MTAGPGVVRPGTAPGAGVPTVGVEEEFLLLRPDGAVACTAPELLAGLPSGVRAQAEFSRCQVETTTGVCTGLQAVGAELLAARRAVARAAEAHGAHVVPSGTPPFDAPGRATLTDDPRYRRLVETVPGSHGEEVTCAAQVHVAVASRDLGVAVLRRLRPWLPLLVALTGNSPLWRGQDTGWSSYRFLVQQGWPTFLPPPACPDLAAYDQRVAQLVDSGNALDERGVYFWARLSPRYPTVELRVADTCPTVADAVLLTGLCRAAVMGAVDDELAGRPETAVPDRQLTATAVAAARRGMSAVVVDPASGGLAPAGAVLAQLVRSRADVLAASGDGPLVERLLAARLAAGSGADRQRVLLHGGTRSAWVRGLTALATLPG